MDQAQHPDTTSALTVLPFLAHGPAKLPAIMGIVNVTPDSFSDGGMYYREDEAVHHALRLLDEGADIIDIGGESTRPPGNTYGEGAMVVDVEEESRRILPVIEAIHAARPKAVISVDTMKPEVAQRAIAAGAVMVNDVSAGLYDDRIWRVAAAFNVPYVMMHGHDPHRRVAIEQIHYANVVETVLEFLRERIVLARNAGVRHIIADVGIGFAKGAEDNIQLIREHKRFLELGVPMLAGISRKSFIGKLLGDLPPAERLNGTLAANVQAVIGGAAILRVHDVRATREFFTVFNAVSS